MNYLLFFNNLYLKIKSLFKNASPSQWKKSEKKGDVKGNLTLFCFFEKTELFLPFACIYFYVL